VTRVLHYNWAQFDDPQGRGGGVSVYLRNLFDHLSANGDDELVMLSAGQHYTAIDRRVRWVETENSLGDRGLRSFRILNSPVKAPAHDMFAAIRDWRTNARIARVFARFLKAEGPFDTVVFHSMEGISTEVLALREKFPAVRFVYMWHNYMPLCPQIELLHQNKTDCRDFDGGAKCPGCLSNLPDAAALIRVQRLGSSLELSGFAGRPPGNFLFGLTMGLFQVGRALRFGFLDLRAGLRVGFGAWRPRRPGPGGFRRIDLAAGPAPTGESAEPLLREAEDYRLWRNVNLQVLNQFDAHWAVSELVAETIAGFGVDRARIRVAPLAMDIHAAPAEMRARNLAKPARRRLQLSFIGYGIPSKGLPFMAEALGELDDTLLKEGAELTIYARLGAQQKRRLAPLARRFAALRFVDGYDRADLARIAAATDLNIVPSIWRETYNQVSYEMLCLGTPSLVSSSVGFAMFLKDTPDFIFRSGDAADFRARLLALVEDPKRIARFFDTAPALPDMAAHLARLDPACPPENLVHLTGHARPAAVPALTTLTNRILKQIGA
jgi:glycosyltransferase involved in cell wall biosynthesis